MWAVKTCTNEALLPEQPDSQASVLGQQQAVEAIEPTILDWHGVLPLKTLRESIADDDDDPYVATIKDALAHRLRAAGEDGLEHDTFAKM
eukprot:15440942-Alexandrium_andersonii.AAC.1